MGRSQVKYRSTHGRGRGRGSGSASGERGGAAGSSSGGGASTRGQGGRRPLESNAFRYDEARDDNEEHDDNEPQDARTYSFRRQFFAGEDNVRDASATPSGAYFQTQTMKQWDADDDDDADVTSGKNAVGVLDFHWLGEQLAQVAPSVRYQMDPKYCVDFAFEPQDAPEDDNDSATKSPTDPPAPAAVASTTAAVARSVPSPAVSQPTPATTQATSADSELDMLLKLSSAALPSVVTSMPLASVSAPSTTAAATSQQQQQQQQQPQQQQQSDEDWLDDVLDM